jgi:hypothetical protein
MNNDPYFYWYEGKVVRTSDLNSRDHHGLLCVDTSSTDPRERYGKFDHMGWRHVRLQNFPKEFQAHLLLLGVS